MKERICKQFRRMLGLMLVCCIAIQFFVPAVSAKPEIGKSPPSSTAPQAYGEISLSESSISATAASGNRTISVYATPPDTWTVSSGASWVTAQRTGESTLKISWQANTAGSTRSATVTASNAGKYASVTITQAANEIRVSPSTLSFSPDGESKSLTASSTSGTSCYVYSTPDWISDSQNGSTFTFTAQSNTTGAGNEDIIELRSGGARKTVHVAQSCYTLGIEPASKSVDAAPGSFSVSISTNGAAATVTPSANWLTVSNSSNTGFTVNYAANGGAERSGTVTVSVGNENRTLTVTQAANEITVSKTGLSFEPAGGYQDVTVSSSSGLACSVDSCPNWISKSPNSVPSGGSIRFTAASNPTDEGRTGEITIMSGTATKKIHVAQDSPSLSVSITEKSVEATPGGFSLTVTADGAVPYVTTDAGTWLSADIASKARSAGGEDQLGEVTYTASVQYTANGSKDPRIGHLYFHCGGVTKTLTVTQAENVVTVSRKGLAFAPGGGSWDVSVSSSSGLDCSVDSRPDWISDSTNSVPSGGSIRFTAASNTTDEEREGRIIIKSGTATETIFVAQDDVLLALSTSSKTVEAAKDEFRIVVTTNCEQPIISSDAAAWLSAAYSGISTRSGDSQLSTDSYEVIVTYEANSRTADRTGHIDFVSGGKQKRLTVTQEGNTLEISASVWNAAPKGETKTFTVAAGNKLFRVKEKPDWIEIVEKDEEHNRLKLRAVYNDTLDERSGEIKIESGSAGDILEENIIVTQAKHSITVRPPQVNILALPMNVEFALYSTSDRCPVVELSPEIDWISIERVLPNKFSVICKENAGSNARTGTIHVILKTSGGETICEQEVTITQKKFELTVSEDSLSFNSAGDVKSMYYVCTAPSVPVEIKNVPGWLKYKKEGTRLFFTADKNTTGRTLMDTVKIRAGNEEIGYEEKEVAVRQDFEYTQLRFQVYKQYVENGELKKNLCKEAYAAYDKETETGTVTDTVHADATGWISLKYTGGNLIISAEGCKSKTFNKNTVETIGEEVYLPETPGKPILTAVWINGADALHGSVLIEYGKACTIKPEIELNDNPEPNIYLEQDGKTFTLHANQESNKVLSDTFDLTEPISVIVQDATTQKKITTSTLDTGLDYFAPDGALEGLSFDLSSGASFTFPEGILAGLQFSVDIPESGVPISGSYEKGKFYICIGLDGDSYDEIRDIAEMMKKSCASNSRPKTPSVKGSVGVSGSISIGGYIEGFYDKSGVPHVASSGLMLSASLGVNYSQQFMIGPVPAFFEAELVGSLDAKLGLNFGSSSVTGSGDIDLGISLRVGIGVGVAEVLSISGGAIGEATVHIGFAGASLHSFLLTLGLKGYVKATLLIFSYQYDFKILEKTWDCLAKSPGSKPEEALQEELQKELVNPDNYQRISIDYLRKGSPFRVRSEADSFVSNAYENAMPQLLTWPDGTKLAIWVGYDAARSDYDALCLFASYYDGSDWCQPFQVENDGTMDASPSAAMIGGRAAVVWQNANASVPNNVTLEGLSAMLDLSLAVFDPESCSFATTRLTQDQTLDMLPAISGDPAEYEDSEEPELCVAWVSNTDNNWFGNGGHNQVKLLTGRICLPEEPADGGPRFVPNEETPTVVAQGCKNINSLAATWNEAPHVYYCMDTDGNPATANDLALYRDGAAMESNGKPRSGVKALNGRAYWTEGKTLYCGGAPIIENMESDRIEIVDAGGVRAVLFTKSEQLCATVYAVLYDEASSSWGSPVAITNGERGIVSFSAAVEADGLRLLVNELEVNSAKDGDQSYGAARIAIYQLPLVTNLRVTEIAHASEYYASGCEMSVDLTLENNGHKMIDSVLVRVLDDSRTVLDSREYAVNLASGSSMVLPCNYMVGAYRPDQQVRFVVTPADQTDDDLSDNSISTSFSWNDLKLDEGGWGRNTENQAYVFATLFNEGHQAVQNVTVSLRTGAEDGPVVDTFTVDEIDRGAVQNVYFPVEETEDEVYFLTIELEDDDVSNNAEFVVVQEELEDFALSVSPATITPGPAEGSSTITLTTSGSVPSFETDADWLSVSLSEPDEGADGTLDQESRTIQAEIHYTGNIQGHPREGHVTFTLGGVSATVTVIQSENYLTFVPDALSFPPEGGTESTDVYPAASGVRVRLATWPEWIDHPTVSGRTFTIVAQPNNTGAARSGELVFTCEDMTVTVPVTQAAHTLSVSAETLTPGPAEGSSAITLTTSGSVPSFETDADWLSVSLPEPEEGADGTLDQESRTIQAEIHYTGNIQGHPREGHVTFTLGGVSATVTVIQSENYLTFVPDALSFPPEGGTESTDVYPAASGVRVRLATWPEWIDHPTVSGRTFTIVAQPNNTGAARSGELVFTCEDMTVTVPVTQEAPVMTVSTTYESVAAAENYFDVTVQTSNGRPKVYYDSVWIGVALVNRKQGDGESPASELQSYTIRVSCAANGTGAARRGGVKFASGGLETILTIDQAANVLTVSPSSLSFGPAGESKTLTASASSGLECTVGDLPDWITAARNGDEFTFTAAANETGAERSATITVSSGSVTQSVSVTQNAHYEPVLDESITVFNYINTETELLLAFSIRNSVAERFDSWYIEVKKIGTDGTLISTKRFGPGQEGEVTEGYVRKASYRDITAKEMGTRYEACFHGFTADGRETYSKTVSNTVRDYILEELLKVENSRQIRTLAADLLNYGAAAQVYFNYDTEHLVNENLSAEAQAAMEEFATTGEAPAELVNTPSGPTIFSSVSVMNRIILSMSVRGMGSADRVQIQVRNHKTGALKDTVEAEKRGSIWIAKYAGFEPGDMRTAFDFVALADDVETGTPLTWSVEGYAREARLNEDSTPEELALFNAILHYIDAVVSAGFGR